MAEQHEIRPTEITTKGTDPWANQVFSLERLQQLMDEFPKPSREVFIFDGTLDDFIKHINNVPGVEVSKITDFFSRPFFGFDIKEVPDNNCVLIGEWRDIQQVLKEKEVYGSVKVFARLNRWQQGDGDGTSRSQQHPNG